MLTGIWLLAYRVMSFIGILSLAAFSLLYFTTAPWWKTAPGRAIMALTFSLTVTFLNSALRILATPPGWATFVFGLLSVASIVYLLMVFIRIRFRKGKNGTRL